MEFLKNVINMHYEKKKVKKKYNQMIAYVECAPNQSKKLYLIDLLIEQSTKR